MLEMDPKLVAWFGDAFDPEAMTLRIKVGQVIKIAGEDTDEVVLSEPVVGHLEAAMQKNGIARDRELMALVAGNGVTPRMLSGMPVSEYNKAMGFLNFFTNAGPPTGEIGSSN